MARKFSLLRDLAARLVAALMFNGPVKVKAGGRQLWFDPKTGTLIPVLAGADGEGEGGEGEGGKEGDGDGEGGDPDGGEGDGGKEKTAEEYREELRKSDRVRKRESAKSQKEIAELKKQLQEKEDADKTEHEKAIEKAREEAKAEALTEAEKGRRDDRLEAAVTRVAASIGVKIGEGDEAKVVKFADSDDALVNIQRRIANGDIDADELFDGDGKVQTDALQSELATLLEDKPHLQAASNGGSKRPDGDGDGGKGSAGKTGEEMSVGEHLKQIQQSRK